MIRSTMVAALLLSGLAARPAAAGEVHIHYTVYAAGLAVAAVEADWDILPAAYKIHTSFHTIGALAIAASGKGESTAEGAFNAGRPQPHRFFSQGTFRGEQRVIQIDYPGREPHIRQMVPPQEEERDPVPPAQQAGTVDGLSAVVVLMRQVNATGRCDGRVETYDGRRLSEVAAQTGPVQQLEATSRSSYNGPALRCDLEGRMTAGFVRDQDQTRLRQPTRATAWFAALTPGGEQVPVRIEIQTRLFSPIMIYAAAAQ